MKKNTTIQHTMLTVLVVFVLVLTGLPSCTNNNDGTAVQKTNDSTNRNDNTINTAPNANGQTNSMNESVKKNTDATDNTDVTDTAFIMKAAEINMEEIKLGKLAQQMSSMGHVKDLGKMMVIEHTEATTKLAALAKIKMVSLPTVESGKITAAYKMLAAKKGKSFDKAYSDMMVNGHKEAIALFEKVNRDTKDNDIKAMTGEMIPKLKTHLEHAEMCQQECEKM